MLRFLTRAVGQPDDGEARKAELEVGFDLDLPRLEPDESVGDRACEHPVDGRHKIATRKRASCQSVTNRATCARSLAAGGRSRPGGEAHRAV